MFPFEIPPGTTIDTLFRQVLPAVHRSLVLPRARDAADSERFVAVVRVSGATSFTLEIQGSELSVREGEGASPSFWVVLDEPTLWKLAGLVPTARADLVLVTDPRVLRRLALVSARAELALIGSGGGRLSVVVATGPSAKRDIAEEGADVVLEASVATLERLATGALLPEDAIADGHVAVRGKKLVAMQYALAFAPFYPRK
jgi:hypothetical protein